MRALYYYKQVALNRVSFSGNQNCVYPTRLVARQAAAPGGSPKDKYPDLKVLPAEPDVKGNVVGDENYSSNSALPGETGL